MNWISVGIFAGVVVGLVVGVLVAIIRVRRYIAAVSAGVWGFGSPRHPRKR